MNEKEVEKIFEEVDGDWDKATEKLNKISLKEHITRLKSLAKEANVVGQYLSSMEDGFPMKFSHDEDFNGNPFKRGLPWWAKGIDESEHNPFFPYEVDFAAIEFVMEVWNLTPLLIAEIEKRIDD